MMQDLLTKAYRSCHQRRPSGLETGATICISTGEFSYPIEEGGAYCREERCLLILRRQVPTQVIFNVWTVAVPTPS